jgi:hypothetical protein
VVLARIPQSVLCCEPLVYGLEPMCGDIIQTPCCGSVSFTWQSSEDSASSGIGSSAVSDDVSIGGSELEGDEPSLGCCWFWGLSGSCSFCSSEFNGILVSLCVCLDGPLVSRRLANACCPNKAEIMKRNRPRAATFPFRGKLKVSLRQYTRACS